MADRAGENARLADQRLRLLPRHAQQGAAPARRKRAAHLPVECVAGITALHTEGARRAGLDRNADADRADPRAGCALRRRPAALRRQGADRSDDPDRHDQSVEPAGDQPALRTPGEYSSVSEIVLRQAETDAEVAACFPVMAQLRPHLASAEELVARVARQRETGYCILAAWCDGKPVALAGYRVQVNLIYGKFLYVRVTGIGPVAVRQPRVRDREAAEGKRIRYSPSIVPPYARRSKSLEVLIPVLYLKGISSGDFEEALAALVGKSLPLRRQGTRAVYRPRPSPASR